MCGDLRLEKNGKIINVKLNDTLPLRARDGQVVHGVWKNWAQAEKVMSHWATPKAGGAQIIDMHKVPVRGFSEHGVAFDRKYNFKGLNVLFTRDKGNNLRLVTTKAGAMKDDINHDRKPLFVRDDYKVPDFGG